MFSKLSHLVTPPKPKKNQKIFSSVIPASNLSSFSGQVTPPSSKKYDKSIASKVVMVEDVAQPTTSDEIKLMVEEKEQVLKDHIECKVAKVFRQLPNAKKAKTWRVRFNFEDLKKRYTHEAYAAKLVGCMHGQMRAQLPGAFRSQSKCPERRIELLVGLTH